MVKESLRDLAFKKSLRKVNTLLDNPTDWIKINGHLWDCITVESVAQDRDAYTWSFQYIFICAVMQIYFHSNIHFTSTFTFMHLADSFIQSDLHCI